MKKLAIFVLSVLALLAIAIPASAMIGPWWTWGGFGPWSWGGFWPWAWGGCGFWGGCGLPLWGGCGLGCW